jgi:allantoinase
MVAKLLDLRVRGGTLVAETGLVAADLGVRDGRIVAHLAPDAPASADEELDARGLHVFPGVVDAHVHLNEPGRTHWEGYASGSRAAAVGGTTTVLDMPLNCLPPTLDATALATKRAAVAGQSLVDYAHWGGLTPGNVAALPALAAEGVVGVKAFMCHSGVDEFPPADDATLFAGLQRAAAWDGIVAVHAENDGLASALAEELRAAGRHDPAAWAASRPPSCELEAVQRALLLAREAGGRVHFVHLSTAAAVRAVAAARAAGVRATCETCPHYLMLDTDTLARLGARAKCAPPLRVRAEVEALWTCVRAGLVDLIASDHSPCTPADKARGGGDIWQAWGGIDGLQTTLAAVLTEGVARRGLPIAAVARLLAGAPARLFGLWPRKGSLNVGADADLALVDLSAIWTLDADALQTRHRQSPYVGQRFQGRVVATLVRGVMVARAGEPCGPAGHGRLLRPQQGP